MQEECDVPLFLLSSAVLGRGGKGDEELSTFLRVWATKRLVLVFMESTVDVDKVRVQIAPLEHPRGFHIRSRYANEVP